MRLFRPLSALVFAAALGISVPAAAQEQDAGGGTAEVDKTGQARSEVRLGLEALDAGRFEEALSHFERASSLVPEANLPHKHAARALEGLGRWSDAVSEYETYLRIKADVSDAAAIRTRIDEIRKTKLDGGSLRFDCLPTDAEVSVDGARVVLTGGHGNTKAPAGDHRVRISAAGHLTRESDVRVTNGAEQTVPCVLDRAPTSLIVDTRPQNREKPPATTPWYGRWWVWATVGVVAIGAGVTTFALTRGDSGPPASEGGDHRFP